MSNLDTKVEFLKGVGSKRALLLNKELSIYTFMDLLTFFPFRYIDRSQYYTVNQINSFDADIQIIGTIMKKEKIGVGKKTRLSVDFSDNTGSVSLVFFKGISWLDKFIQIGKKYLIFGKPSKYGKSISFIHPEMDLLDVNRPKLSYNLHPVYHSTEKLNLVGLNSKGISKLVFQLLSSINNSIIENLSKDIVRKYQFLSRKDSFYAIHFPSELKSLNLAIYRFKFEELFFLQVSLLKQKILRQKKYQYTTLGIK